MAYADEYPNPVQLFTLPIAASATSSASAAKLGGLRVVGFLFTGSLAGGSMTLTASWDGSNYYAVRSISGSLAAVTATSIGYHGLNPDYQALLAGVYDLYVSRAASAAASASVIVVAQPR